MSEGKGKGNWKIGSHSESEYKKILFDEKRLKSRENIFEKITLRSLEKIYQNKDEDIELKVQLLTSVDLPSKNIEFLENKKCEYPFLDVKYYSIEEASLSVGFKKYLNEYIEVGEVYASVRLDDDDALSIDWLKTLKLYMRPEFSGFVIALSRGYAAKVGANGEILSIATMKWRFPSAGLALINVKSESNNLNIYECGSHGLTDDRYPTIVDSTKNYFMRSYFEFNDSGDKFPSKNEVDQIKKGMISKFFFLNNVFFDLKEK